MDSSRARPLRTRLKEVNPKQASESEGPGQDPFVRCLAQGKEIYRNLEIETVSERDREEKAKTNKGEVKEKKEKKQARKTRDPRASKGP